LFLSKDDARIGNGQQALWIGAAKAGKDVEYPRKGFVPLSVPFDTQRTREQVTWGDYLGEIVDVESIRLVK